jgi:hypothetical protein
MTPKISLIIGIAAAMGVFAPVATGSTDQSGGLPVETAKPAIVTPLRILHTRIEGGRTSYRFGNRGLWME